MCTTAQLPGWMHRGSEFSDGAGQAGMEPASAAAIPPYGSSDPIRFNPYACHDGFDKFGVLRYRRPPWDGTIFFGG